MVAAADGASLDYLGIDPDIRVIVLRCCAQDPWILWQIALRQRDHDAARTRTTNPETQLVTDRSSSWPTISRSSSTSISAPASKRNAAG